MIALVIPFIDCFDEVTLPCIQHAVQNSRHAFELIMVDNGSDRSYKADIKKLLKPSVHFRYIRNEQNLGVIESFNQGVAAAQSDVICFIHNDVLLQEVGWEKKIEHYFDEDPRLGMAGLLGGNGVHPDGGRINVVSNMQGIEWGGCACHEVVALHHGSHLQEIFPAMVIDGAGLFFRRECIKQIQEQTDALDPAVRAPHHWYDRNLTLHAVELGWHAAVIGVGFDHWSGATANRSEKYLATSTAWLAEHRPGQFEGKAVDQSIYDVGLEQFKQEWGSKLPAIVNIENEVTWKKVF